MSIIKTFYLACIVFIIHANVYATETHSKVFLCFNQAGISTHWNTISTYIQFLPRGSKVTKIVSRKEILKPQLTFVELSSASLLSDHIVEAQQKSALIIETHQERPLKDTSWEIITILTVERSSFWADKMACFLPDTEAS